CPWVCLPMPPGTSLPVPLFSVPPSSPLLVTASTHSTASFLPLTVISSLPSVTDTSGPGSVLTSFILTLAGWVFSVRVLSAAILSLTVDSTTTSSLFFFTSLYVISCSILRPSGRDTTSFCITIVPGLNCAQWAKGGL